MKILITGGAGFIGSHISTLLLDQGHTVLIYDNLSKSFTSNLDPRSLFLEGDIKDTERLKKALQGVDAVIHMASLAIVPESVKNPLLYADNNIIGSIHLYEAMKEVEVKKIVFSSSATVYGNPKILPLTEDMPISSTNPYGATKVANEALLQSYHFNYGWDVTILRYFNPYGPGENHQPETHAIPNFIKSALSRKSIPLYWKGEQIRDFIYVEDLASAHIAALELSGLNIFNVGSEKGVKVIDVVKTIENIIGYKIEIEDLGEREGDVAATYASSKLIRSKTKWRAKVSLKEGLNRTIDWFKKNF